MTRCPECFFVTARATRPCRRRVTRQACRLRLVVEFGQKVRVDARRARDQHHGVALGWWCPRADVQLPTASRREMRLPKTSLGNPASRKHRKRARSTAISPEETMPKTFVAAVRARYEHEVGSQEGGELVGGDKIGKQQALDVLRRVFVPGEGIDSAGPDGEISKVCGAIRELDLGSNPLGTWEPIVKIATQLPALTSITLDKIPLAPLDVLPDGFATTFAKLATLCLNDTGMAWGQLLLIAGSMPALTELHFASNKVASLQPPTGADVVASLGGVHSLYLEDNLLDSWESVLPIAQLPKLSLLNLNHNQIASVPPHAGDASAGFGVLKHLMLRANPIKEWASIDALDTFPQLTEMRLAELPLIKDSSGAVARRTIIARLGKLVALNGSEVRVRERDDAERFYLRAVAQGIEGGLPKEAVIEKTKGGADGAPAADISDERRRQEARGGRRVRPARRRVRPPAAGSGRARGPPGGGGARPFGLRGVPEIELRVPETAEAKLQQVHPRWADLLRKHGTHASISGGTKASSGVIANELIEVTMRSLVAETAHLPAASRKLPGGLPLKSVRMIACQLPRLGPQGHAALRAARAGGRHPEELDDDFKSLADMGVVSGG